MTRLVSRSDMSTDEIIQCGYDALAIIDLCENAAWDLSERGENAALAGSISNALKLASKLLSEVHGTLEINEGLIEKARRGHRS